MDALNWSAPRVVEDEAATPQKSRVGPMRGHVGAGKTEVAIECIGERQRARRGEW
jgi:hypothetical protein